MALEVGRPLFSALHGSATGQLFYFTFDVMVAAGRRDGAAAGRPPGDIAQPGRLSIRKSPAAPSRAKDRLERFQSMGLVLAMKFHGTIAVVEDEVLSVDEAAAWLKVDAVTVQRLLREGRLAGRKIGARQWRISADALKAYVECDRNPKED